MIFLKKITKMFENEFGRERIIPQGSKGQDY